MMYMIIKKIYHEERIELGFETLKGQKLDDLDLSYAILSGMDLNDSSLKNTTLDIAQLKRANLSDANLGHAALSKANLENAMLVNAHMENMSAFSTIFRSANLKLSNLTNANLAGSYLSNANLKLSNLTNTNFERCILYGADMRGINIETANFQGAVFDQKTKWPEGFNPYLKGAKLVGNPIRILIEDLDPSLSEGIQKSAMSKLMNVKSQFYYLLFSGGKHTWPNAVKIIRQIGYPENKSAIPSLFKLLIDVNWPGAIEAMELLAEIKEKNKLTLIKGLEEAICKAYSDGELCWLWGINHFVKYYAKLKEEDFLDSDIFRLLKYGDEENYAYDYEIHHFLRC